MKTLMVPLRKDMHPGTDDLPFGMTHPNDTPCPFANDDLPRGYINTCCSLCTTSAAEALCTLGRPVIERFLRGSLPIDALPTIAQELRQAADSIEQRYVEPTDRDGVAQPGGIIDIETGNLTPWSRHRLDEALASIRQAADWYQKVEALGFDVEAWY